LKKRSIAELAFRARQEASNLLLLVQHPKFAGEMPLTLALPNARDVSAGLRGSGYAAVVEATAREILVHRFPLLGRMVDTGTEICWRRDYVHGAESGTAYFRRIPYLNYAGVGDHKFIWELNRHQHLVLLAQAFLFTGEPEFAREVFHQLESWFEQNPFQRGINWASALEVGFRALSWIWLYHFIAQEMPDRFRRRFLTELYRHGRHLAENLSVYFSPNTHLLGEAVALHTLGRLFPAFPGSGEWRRRGAEIVQAQLDFQVKADGSHFEQSTYYHVYALDFFLFFHLLNGRRAKMEPVLTRMAEYLHWLLGPAGQIAFVGDDDGGRLSHPYGERNQFGRATLATCAILLGREEWAGTADDVAEQAAWWIGVDALRATRPQRSVPCGSRFFKDSGTAFIEAGDLFVQMDCGPFGYGSAGHSHSDTLSVLVMFCGEQVFLDPGTYTYVGDPDERNWFRGSAAHNTICIDGLDQAHSTGPFRWESKPKVTMNVWKPSQEGGFIDATCRYAGFVHRRRVLLERGRLLVLDEIGENESDATAGEHACNQIWQLGPAASKVRLSFSAPAVESDSRYSPAFGIKCPGTQVIAKVTGHFPLEIVMLLETGESGAITIEEARRRVVDEAVSAREAADQ